jgi:uncharacterized protein with HEPN domain
MHPEVKIWLKDIEMSIKEIHEFFPAHGIYKDFKDDLKTRKAIERNIEIIGEAMRRIREVDPLVKISDSRKISDTRNRIIHGYDTVSPDVIWLILTRYIPILESEVKELLK